MNPNSIAEAKTRLKTATNVRDCSTPQVTEEEIDLKKYSDLVREVDLQHWISVFEEYTFKTESIILSPEEINALFEENKKFRQTRNRDWRSNPILKQLESRIDKVISGSPIFSKGAFVKTSCRSPKDAVVHSEKLLRLYHEHWNNLQPSEKNDNGKVIAILQASLDAMKVTTAAEALDLLTTSDRVYEDIEGLKLSNAEFHVVVRQWEEIPIDFEFRAFCKNGKITALSQYNSQVCFPRLLSLKPEIEKTIIEFYEKTILPLITEKAPSIHSQYVLDFAFIDGDLKKPCIIEMNPFHSSTGCLFARDGIDKEVVENGPFEFRILESLRTGLQVWWPISWRDIMNTVDQ